MIAKLFTMLLIGGLIWDISSPTTGYGRFSPFDWTKWLIYLHEGWHSMELCMTEIVYINA
jgi:hypothetical protein